MKNYKLFLLLVGLLSMSQSSIAQIRFDAQVAVGAANIYEEGFKTDNGFELNATTWDIQSPKLSYQIGGLLSSGGESKFGWAAGLNYSFRSTDFFQAREEGFNIPEKSWTEDAHYLSVPLLATYKLGNIIKIQAGPTLATRINNVSADSEFILFNDNRFDLAGRFGLEFSLTEKLTIGANATHSIVPFNSDGIGELSIYKHYNQAAYLVVGYRLL